MTTFNEIRLQQLLEPFNNKSSNDGILSLNNDFTDSKYTYDGLYQDPLYDIATSNPIKAMQSGYKYMNEDAINRYLKEGAFDMSGNVPANYDRAIDFKRYFENRPLKTLDYGNRFENFDPRIGLKSQIPQNLEFLNTQTKNEIPKVDNQIPKVDNQIPKVDNILPINSLGIDTSYRVANEPDEEQVEYLTEQEPSGIAKLFEFLQRFSPLRGIAALNDKLKQSSMYRPSTTGVFGYTPAQLNQMNALGGYYSEPERERRRRANRISNMLQRAAAGKNYSQKNLSNLMNQFGMGDVDTGSMIQSIKESSNMGYGRGDVGQRATPGRDYSSSPGAMAGDMEYGEE